MEGLGDELDELEAEMAALEMEDVDVHTDTIKDKKKEEPVYEEKKE